MEKILIPPKSLVIDKNRVLKLSDDVTFVCDRENIEWIFDINKINAKNRKEIIVEEEFLEYLNLKGQVVLNFNKTRTAWCNLFNTYRMGMGENTIKKLTITGAQTCFFNSDGQSGFIIKELETQTQNIQVRILNKYNIEKIKIAKCERLSNESCLHLIRCPDLKVLDLAGIGEIDCWDHNRNFFIPFCLIDLPKECKIILNKNLLFNLPADGWECFKPVKRAFFDQSYINNGIRFHMIAIRACAIFKCNDNCDTIETTYQDFVETVMKAFGQEIKEINKKQAKDFEWTRQNKYYHW